MAGTISFENEAFFINGEEGYKLVWDDSMIFRNLTSTDKVRVSTTQAERGEILDRNGRVLAGKGTASSVGIVPGKLENREEAIAQIAGLLEITTEVIEKNLSAKWVKDDSFVLQASDSRSKNEDSHSTRCERGDGAHPYDHTGQCAV